MSDFLKVLMTNRISSISLWLNCNSNLTFAACVSFDLAIPLRNFGDRLRDVRFFSRVLRSTASPKCFKLVFICLNICLQNIKLKFSLCWSYSTMNIYHWMASPFYAELLRCILPCEGRKCYSWCKMHNLSHQINRKLWTCLEMFFHIFRSYSVWHIYFGWIVGSF